MTVSYEEKRRAAQNKRPMKNRTSSCGPAAFGHDSTKQKDALSAITAASRAQEATAGPGGAFGSAGETGIQDNTHNTITRTESFCCLSAAETRSAMASSVPLLLLVLFLGAALSVLPREPRRKLLLTSVASIAAFVAADWLMPVLGRKLMERGVSSHLPLPRRLLCSSARRLLDVFLFLGGFLIAFSPPLFFFHADSVFVRVFLSVSLPVSIPLSVYLFHSVPLSLANVM